MRITSVLSILLLILICSLEQSIAQHVLEGKVLDWNEATSEEIALPGANVHWAGTSIAVSTDSTGTFRVPLAESLPAFLVASFVGLRSDTLLIENSDFTMFRLIRKIELQGIEVSARKEAIGISLMKPINTEVITEKEILKAACCNLSEAFEANPTVSVAYKDAVTGAKEIQMLGLSGIYSQLMTENIVASRGISGIYGLTFIPGPWMESIQVSKGSGSVIHGYESTTGQINVELLKPESHETPRFYLNLFREAEGNSEINTHYRKQFNDKWSSILMLHANYMGNEVDHDKDSFKNMLTGNQFNVYNRWQYHSSSRLESQLGLKFLTDLREGGQVKSAAGSGPNGEIYTSKIENQRAEVFAKLGVIYPEKPAKSIGNIVDVSMHKLSSQFGLKTFNATQKNLFIQSIFQNAIDGTGHQYKVGADFRYDETEQDYNKVNSDFSEKVPGLFVEHTYTHLEKFTSVLGLRQDYHNTHGWIFTPRLHAKYNFTENFLLRASGGKSFRVPSLYSDNISVMASSKELFVTEEILPEKAWNYGLNMTMRFKLADRDGSFSSDFYRTDFLNQLIVDMYSDSSRILFYNLNGESFSNSLQFTVNYEVLPGLELRLAYKMDDVKSVYNGTLLSKPLVSKNKALMNLAYFTPDEKWKFVYTLIWDGKKRLPQALNHTDHYAMETYSPDFFIMHAQITKVFKRFELYGGAENLLDFTQHNPVINPQNPFSNDFDASRIWGPIDGRRMYLGLRYKLY